MSSSSSVDSPGKEEVVRSAGPPCSRSYTERVGHQQHHRSAPTRQERFRFIQLRHEGAAAFMACVYAKWTGRIGVCLATSGPGGIHLLNGLMTPSSTGSRSWPSPACNITI